MRAIGKFVCLAVPLLAGCAALQVSSQGAGSNSGIKGGSTSSLSFPEDRDWLGDAGLGQYKDYAKYLRPNVGIPEAELGMSMKAFREIEKKIQVAVLREDTKVVLDRIKKDKYGITTTANGAIVAPGFLNGTDFAKWFRALPEDQQAISMQEFKNSQKMPTTISSNVSDYILSTTDKVLIQSGYKPNKNRLLRAKAFVAGANYFTIEAVEYESLQKSFGPPSRPLLDKVYQSGAFVLDRPRGLCKEESLTFVSLTASKGEVLNISSTYYILETYTRSPSSNYFLGLNHGAGIVRYGSKFLEAYDITQAVQIDSKDADAVARWVTTRNGFEVNQSYKGSDHSSNLLQSNGDPISTMTREQFQALDKNISKQVRDAVK